MNNNTPYRIDADKAVDDCLVKCGIQDTLMTSDRSYRKRLRLAGFLVCFAIIQRKPDIIVNHFGRNIDDARIARRLERDIERLADLLGSVRGMWVMTFHAMCVRILRDDAELLGYPPNFSIYDDDDSRRLMREIMADLDIDPKQYPLNSLRAIGDTKFPVIMAVLSMWGVSVPLGSFLALHCGLGLLGVWIGFCADMWTRGLAMLIRWKTKAWVRHAVAYYRLNFKRA